MFPQSEDLKAVNKEYHKRREEARRNAYSLSEFGEQEIVRFDLDTARITGRENDRTYRKDPAIDLLGERGRDIREDPKR